MNHARPLATALSVGLFCLLGSGSASAQVDRLYPLGSNKAISGTVTESSRDGVKLKIGANAQNYVAGEFRKILYQGDPSGLTKGREFALDGQYEQALEELRGIDLEKITREVIRADVRFFIVMSEARMALEGRGDKAAAVTAARGFATKFTDSWHFYEVAKLLGDLAVALKSYDQALKYYGSLDKATSVQTRIEAAYLTGLTKLQQGKAAEAKADFDKVIGVTVATPGVARLKTLATAGKAVAVAKAGDGAAGLKMVQALITDLNPTDVEVAARIYNAQGAGYEANNDREGAMLAYLHTHLLFSSQPDAHAEALVRMVELWPLLGKPERAAAARQELQQRYPGFAN